MGRNMFGPIRGDWDREWNGWWGDDPPFHAPVFVLTHHPREPQPMAGGTTFNFVTEGIESALAQAREAAGDGEFHVLGGADTVNQYLAAGLIDELRLHIVPLTIGAGARVFEGVPPLALERVVGAGSQLGRPRHLRRPVLRAALARPPTPQRTAVSTSVLDMSVSVDGFIADTDDYLGGEDGERLHAWAASQDPPIPSSTSRTSGGLPARCSPGVAPPSSWTTGAVPRRDPDLRAQSPAATAARPLGLSPGHLRRRRHRERHGAGQGRSRRQGRPVRGGYVAQRALEAGVLDEVQLHVVPVLLGEGAACSTSCPGSSSSSSWA